MYDPTQFRRPLPTCQTRRSRVTGFGRGGYGALPSGKSVQKITRRPGAASSRGALQLLFPPPGQWAGQQQATHWRSPIDTKVTFSCKQR